MVLLQQKEALPMLTIRRETPEDYQAVEDLTRKAFITSTFPGA